MSTCLTPSDLPPKSLCSGLSLATLQETALLPPPPTSLTLLHLLDSTYPVQHTIHVPILFVYHFSAPTEYQLQKAEIFICPAVFSVLGT